jgi:hypothetical protein
MRKLTALFGTGSTLLLLSVSSAMGAAPFSCNSKLNGVTLNDVVVPKNGVCVLKNSTVHGSVQVATGAYFQATGTKIHGDVNGNGAKTIFIDTASRVGGSVTADRTAQVLVYHATVGGSLTANRANNEVQICGTTVKNGDVAVKNGQSEVLIGDPTTNCGANTVRSGNLAVNNNATDVFFGIAGNTIKKGDLKVNGNGGPSTKLVQNNRGGDHLSCSRNGKPFTGSPNGNWKSKSGQCS